MCKKYALLGAAIALIPLAGAQADIITALSSAPVATGDGYFAYTYNVQLSGGQLDPVSNGSPVQFGTVYDFGPLVTTAGVVNNPGSAGSVFITKTGLLADSQNQFIFSFNGIDSPAGTAGTLTTVNDNPSLTNIRFTYTGSSGIYVQNQSTTLSSSALGVAPGSTNLGTFTVYSPVSRLNTSGVYDGQTYKGTNNTQQANFGSLSVPQQAASAVPEPLSWAMMCGGFGLLGVTLRRNRARARLA